MRYEENPFNVLHVSMRDSQDKILDKVEDLSLTLDEAICSQAASILTNPTKRLEAEVSWFPGYTPKKIKEAFEDAKSAPDEFIDNLSEDELSYADINAEILAFLNIQMPHLIKDYLLKCISDLEKIDSDALFNELNKERNVGGIPVIPNIEVLTTVLQNRKQELADIFYSFLKSFGQEKLVDILTAAIEENTNSGKLEAAPILLWLIEKYEIDIQSDLEAATDKVQQQLTFISNSVNNTTTDETLDVAVDSLDYLLKSWDRLAQPIQVSMQSQGLEHSASKDLAYAVRQLALNLYNEHNHLNIAKRITEIIGSVFAEVVTVAEKTNEDLTILNNISSRNEYAKNHPLVRQAYSESKSLGIKESQKNPKRGLENAKSLRKHADILRTLIIKMIAVQYPFDRPINRAEVELAYETFSSLARQMGKELKPQITMDNGGEILVAAMDAYAQAMLECVMLYANATKKWRKSAKFLLEVKEYAFENETKNKIEDAIATFNSFSTTENEEDDDDDEIRKQLEAQSAQASGCLIPIISALILCALLFT